LKLLIIGYLIDIPFMSLSHASVMMGFKYQPTNNTEHYTCPHKQGNEITKMSDHGLDIIPDGEILNVVKTYDHSLITYMIDLMTRYNIAPTELFGTHNIVKEITESSSVLRYINQFKIDGKILCYVVGEGNTPRVSYILSLLHPDWMIVSMDPEMNLSWVHTMPNLLLLRMYDYDVNLYPHVWFDRVIVTGVHSHNDMATFYDQINKPKLLVALPCCVGINLSNPYEIISSTGIFSGKNIIYSWKCGRWDKNYDLLHDTDTNIRTNVLNIVNNTSTVTLNGMTLEFIKTKNKPGKMIFTFDRDPVYLNYLFRFIDNRSVKQTVISVLTDRSIHDIIFAGMVFRTLNIYVKNIESVQFIIDQSDDYSLICKILVGKRLDIVSPDHTLLSKDRVIVKIGNDDMVTVSNKLIHLTKKPIDKYEQTNSYLFGYTNTVYCMVQGIDVHTESRSMFPQKCIT
jgi:hypothetical protein